VAARRRSGGARHLGQDETARAERLRRRVGLVIVALALAGLAATVVISTIRSKQAEEIAGVRSFDGLSQEHVTGPVAYKQSPPVGGAHDEVWLNCGAYDRAVRNEQAVHSLEHGAVWVTYRPDLSRSQLEKLRRLIDGHSHAILSPFPRLRAPIVASAWGKQLQLPNADDPRLPEFVKVYEQGRQTPERGASCSGGVGTPIP
jgi:hypothetical protein